jgi:hypothetical protein
MITLKKFNNSNYSETLDLKLFLKDVKLIVFHSEAFEVKINVKKQGRIYYHDWMLKEGNWVNDLKGYYKNRLYVSEKDFKKILEFAKDINIQVRMETNDEWEKWYKRKRG